MSHISEGDLHAYLDGALEEYPSTEARRVREHLESCSECKVRLDDERAIRDEAHAILGGVVPGIEMVPLEELRARAVARAEPGVELRTGSSRIARIGWAASILVALGVGYSMRGQSVAPVGPNDAPVAVQEAEVVAPIEAPVAAATNDPTPESALQSDAAEPVLVRDERAQEAERRARPAAATPSALEVATAPEPARAEERAAPADALEELERIPLVADASGAVLPVSDGGAEVQSPQESLRSLVFDAGTGPGEVTQERTSAERSRVPVVSALQGASNSSVGRRVEEDDRERAEAVEEGRMGVADLETLSISWIADGVVAGGVRVEQALENGDTLTLLHLPEGVQPDDVPIELAVGERELIVPRGEGWLLVRAKRSFDDLRQLVLRLDGEG